MKIGNYGGEKQSASMRKNVETQGKLFDKLPFPKGKKREM